MKSKKSKRPVRSNRTTTAGGGETRRASRSAAGSVAGVRKKAVKAIRKVGRSAREMATNTAGALARTTTTVATTLLDQNRDGQLDQRDVKLATQRIARSTKSLASEIAATDTAKGAATAAAFGALIAVPVPVIGPVGGAAGGALAYGTVRAVSKISASMGDAAAGVLGRKPARRHGKRVARAK